MTLNKFEPGVNTSFSTELNQNTAAALRSSGLNTVRQLMDRAITYSAGMIDNVSDAAFYSSTTPAYRNSTGQFLYPVLTSDGVYKAGHAITNVVSGDTTHNPDSYTDPGNAFDSNFGTGAVRVNNSVTSATTQLGKTFGAKTVTWAYFCVFWNTSVAISSNTVNIQTYNGTTWTTVQSFTPYNPSSFTGWCANYVYINASVQGVRAQIVTGLGTTGNVNHWVYELQYQTASTLPAQEHPFTITSGKLPSTTSSACLVPFISDWESGADIQYKLQSGQVVSGETVHNPQSIGNSSNAFDGNTGTSTSSITLTVDTYLGKTFASAKTILNIQFISTLTGSGSTAVSTEYYDGSTWYTLGDLAYLYGAGVIAYTVPVNRSCSGVRVKYSASGGHGLTFQEIYIREVSNDSGWLNCSTTTPISNFTAFTSEPLACVIKLIPKSSSPTAGYPSIRGFTLFAE